jgi:hypothetical protein
MKKKEGSSHNHGVKLLLHFLTSPGRLLKNRSIDHRFSNKALLKMSKYSLLAAS